MPPLKCVGCGDGKQQARRVSCLHTLCANCLEANTTDTGHIKCPYCLKLTQLRPGVSPLLSLPRSYPAPTLKEISSPYAEAATPACDECDDRCDAKSVCLDCNIKLCQPHTVTHPISKGTRNHKVRGLLATEEQLNGATTNKPVPRRCAVHLSKSVERYCKDCSQVLCALCIDRGTHGANGHTLLSAQDAAKETRESLRAAFDSSSDRGGTISTAIQKASRAIQSLHQQTETASDQAKEFFARLMEALNKRQDVVLEQLDERRDKKLIPLEKQSKRLEEGLVQHRSMQEILESCDDDVDMLLLGDWLSVANATANDLVKSESAPTVTSAIMFCGTDTEQLLDDIEHAGATADCSNGELKCTASVPMVGEDVCVSIELDTTAAIKPSDDQLAGLGLQVFVTGPDNDTLPRCTPVKWSGQGRLETSFRSAKDGEHAVSATINGVPIRGSPLKCNLRLAKTIPLFDSGRCHGDLEISNAGRTVRRKAGSCHKAVCTEMIPMQLCKAELSVRLGGTVDRSLFVCVCSSTNPTLNTYHGKQAELFGWWGGGEYRPCNGTLLGQPWQSGDVLRLSLDLDNQTLTGLHERSGVTSTLRNVQGTRFYWYVSIYTEGAQVSIIT